MSDDDEDFMTGIKELFDFSDDKIDQIIEKIDSDQLLELQDAITHKDKERASTIIDLLSLDEDDEEDKKVHKKKHKKHHKKHKKNVEFRIGDSVLVGDDEIEGTVEKPTAPHNLIGVKIDGKLKMYHKKDVKLDETVLGMTPMFDISRMQELAGIQTATNIPSTVEIEMVKEEPVKDCSCLERAISALDELESALMGITVAELKTVRARIYQISSIMNESISAPRKLK